MLKYLVILGFIAVASAQHLAPHRYLPTPPKKAVVRIGNVDNGATGSVYFTETSEGIHITGAIDGLSQGLHGFHVHAIGDITGGCLSTGGHFNPHNLTHGAPNVTERHVGDLGNIEANVNGTAVIDFYDTIIALSGEHNILGRGVVVHQDQDDLGLGGEEDSKTTGHAGARVGCGIIGTLDETNASTIVLPSILAVVLALVLRML